MKMKTKSYIKDKTLQMKVWTLGHALGPYIQRQHLDISKEIVYFDALDWENR